jgi:catechol 2,3-dioxygenase
MATRDLKGTDRPPAPRLHHINLKTRRLQEMISWYGEVVGPLQVTFADERGAWTTNDAAHHRIAFIASPALTGEEAQVDRIGLHHTAFEFSSLDELLDAYLRLAGMEILPHFAVDHGMTTSFYYADPEGNSVELQADNFGDWERSREWMRTSPEFAADPIGPQVDPSLMAAARDAGDTVAELHRRAYAGEFKPAEPMDPRVPLA